MIRVVTPSPAARPGAIQRSLRARTYRQTPTSVQARTALWPVSVELILDSRHTPPAPGDQAIFLQPHNEPMVFVVPVAPRPGATNVPWSEEIRAHIISDFASTAGRKIFLNGLEYTTDVYETTYDGFFAILRPGSAILRRDTDGLTHARVEAVEDRAGTVYAEWTFQPAIPQAVVSFADGQIPILRGIVSLADALFSISQRIESGATGQIPLRASGGVFGEATGRVVVGEYRLSVNASGTIDIAEIFFGTTGSGTLEIHGYATFNEGSGTLELSGPFLGADASGTLNIQELFLATAGSGTANIGIAVMRTTDAGTAEVWGEQAGHSAGRLVVRIQPISPTMMSELSQAGIRFASEAALSVGAGESFMDEVYS